MSAPRDVGVEIGYGTGEPGRQATLVDQIANHCIAVISQRIGNDAGGREDQVCTGYVD